MVARSILASGLVVFMVSFLALPSRAQDGDLKKDDEQGVKYHWLFKEKQKAGAPRQEPQASTSGFIQRLDGEIKQARKQYLSGDQEKAIAKYKECISLFESLVEDTPPGHPLLVQLDRRYGIFDELATKIMGPVNVDPSPEASEEIFKLMEQRRVCRRNLVLKSAGPVNFFDVAGSLVSDEAELLTKLIELHEDVPSQQNRAAEAALRNTLQSVRKSLAKSSRRYSALRFGSPCDLTEFRKHVLGKDELVIDCGFLADRMVVGIITREQARYHQIEVNRSDVDRSVLLLQDKLKEFTLGDDSSFMGHAWKEPSRRMYRTLFSRFPPLPSDKTAVFIIPDRSLWYLPASMLLDPEDRPFGKDKIVSFIPSADMLKTIRELNQPSAAGGGNILLFESLPWIRVEDLKDESEEGIHRRNLPSSSSEDQKIEDLILTNPVYPKPSEIVVAIQKLFKKFDVWVGPTATIDRLAEYKGKSEQVTVLGVPLSMTDSVTPDKQPEFFFSPGKKGAREFAAAKLLGVQLQTGLMILPASWFEVEDDDSVLGDGPLLLAVSALYSGQKSVLINYSDPTWGKNNPFLISTLKKLAEGASPAQALLAYPKEMPADLDPSFSGKPPAWAGWILIGDPN